VKGVGITALPISKKKRRIMKLSEKGNTKQYLESKFKRGKQTCPVCGKTDDWKCWITEDEGLVYCSSVPNESGIIKYDRYEHIMRTDTNIKPQSANVTMNDNSTKSTKADADRLNDVYSALLEDLKLSAKHADDLLSRRGLSDTVIAKNLYATVPHYNKRYEIAQKLAKSFNLEGVPGFFHKGNVWVLNTTFPGFYVPYRDELGRIIGLQIRRDEEGKDKYMWLSSDAKLKGASSGTPPHFVNADLADEKKEVFLTEGALKADVIGSILGVTVIATAGVSVINPVDLTDKLLDTFPDLEKVVVAYDIDWQTNEAVKLALFRLLDGLKERNIKVEVALWDLSQGKGLDDVLVNEAFTEDSVKYIPADEFQAMVSSIVVEEEEATGAIEPVDEVMNDELISDEDFIEAQELAFEQVDFDLGQEPEQELEREDKPIMYSYGEFSELEVEDVEKVIFGLVRGGIGLMVASTNVGKTTLALNLSLSATGRREFNPLLNNSHQARRVLYIDGEATKAELQTDIAKMLEVFTTEQVESVKDNLFLICDEELDDEALDLVNEEHFNLIKEKALACKPDLIIVDTLSALMDLEDENDNAKVKKEVIKPLRKLARQTNSGVLFLHHSGKFNEGFSNSNKAYSGRGASLGASSRIVMVLEKSDSVDNGVKLSCSKVKGKKFSDSILELDAYSRWFKFIANDKPEKVSNYEKVIEFVINFGNPVKRQDIVNALANVMSDKAVDRHLKKAFEVGRLNKTDYGFYSAPMNLESELSLAE
jgi:hypothetical protein